jgi:threonine dehydratase
MTGERSFDNRVVDGDRALEIVNTYKTRTKDRPTVEDHFTVEKLRDEFPRFAQFLGADALYLANAADNLAGTFKWRGAIVGATQLYERGVRSILVPSAGNALRGSALSARFLEIGIHGVVPTSAPRTKSEGAKEELWNDPRFQLHVEGNSFNDSLGWAMDHPELGALLHPFDDPNVIRGQGTILDDILASENGGEVSRIVVPVGGAGLLAGILTRRDELQRYDIAVDAIEAEGSHSLSLSLDNNEISTADKPNPRYGGSAVKRIGRYAFEICRDAKNLHLHVAPDTEVDQLVDSYEADRYDLYRNDTPNFEPTTLVAISGLRQVTHAHPNEHIVVVGTGYNDSLRPQVPTRQSAFRTWR